MATERLSMRQTREILRQKPARAIVTPDAPPSIAARGSAYVVSLPRVPGAGSAYVVSLPRVPGAPRVETSAHRHARRAARGSA